MITLYQMFWINKIICQRVCKNIQRPNPCDPVIEAVTRSQTKRRVNQASIKCPVKAKVSYSKGKQKQIYILGTILLPIKTINREPCKTTRERKIAKKSKNLYNVYETNIHCT